MQHELSARLHHQVCGGLGVDKVDEALALFRDELDRLEHCKSCREGELSRDIDIIARARAMYPQALFILTEREPAKWNRSTVQWTLYKYLNGTVPFSSQAEASALRARIARARGPGRATRIRQCMRLTEQRVQACWTDPCLPANASACSGSKAHLAEWLRFNEDVKRLFRRAGDIERLFVLNVDTMQHPLSASRSLCNFLSRHNATASLSTRGCELPFPGSRLGNKSEYVNVAAASKSLSAGFHARGREELQYVLAGVGA